MIGKEETQIKIKQLVYHWLAKKNWTLNINQAVMTPSLAGARALFYIYIRQGINEKKKREKTNPIYNISLTIWICVSKCSEARVI